MNTHEHSKNDEIDLPTAHLLDLPITDDQANHTKAGGQPSGRLYVATNVGIY